VSTMLLALDVTRQARAAGLDKRVALSAGIVAGFRDADTATREAFEGAFAKLVIDGEYPRIPLSPDAHLVDMNGRRYVVAEREEGLAIVTLLEAQIAGPGFSLDVREREEPVLQ
jgi:hypothetical protein